MISGIEPRSRLPTPAKDMAARSLQYISSHIDKWKASSDAGGVETSALEMQVIKSAYSLLISSIIQSEEGFGKTVMKSIVGRLIEFIQEESREKCPAYLFAALQIAISHPRCSPWIFKELQSDQKLTDGLWLLLSSDDQANSSF